MVGSGDAGAAGDLGRGGRAVGAGRQLSEQPCVPGRGVPPGRAGLRAHPGAVPHPHQGPQAAVLPGPGRAEEERARPQDMQVLRRDGPDPQLPGGARRRPRAAGPAARRRPAARGAAGRAAHAGHAAQQPRAGRRAGRGRRAGVPPRQLHRGFRRVLFLRRTPHQGGVPVLRHPRAAG